MKVRPSVFVVVLLVLLIAAETIASPPKPLPPPPQPGFSPPAPVGFPHVKADWYVPGPIRMFNAVFIGDGKGRSFSSNTRDITAGWSAYQNLNMPRLDFVSGKHRGEANLWFSGNAAWAFASSTYTKEVSPRRWICARVNSFYVYTFPPQSTPDSCDLRGPAWSYVTSASLQYWSGCMWVLFWSTTPYQAVNNTLHSFTKGNGTMLFGTATANVGYNCQN